MATPLRDLATSAVLEYPSLDLTGEVVARINRVISSLECISSDQIRHNVSSYTDAANNFSYGVKQTQQQKYRLSQAWQHSGATVVTISPNAMTSPQSYSQQITHLSGKLEHIAHMADLSRKYAREHIAKLNTILPKLNAAYENEADPDQRRLIQHQATAAAELTDKNLTAIAHTYRNTLRGDTHTILGEPITVGNHSDDATDDSHGPLGLSLEHLPPLWNPTGIPGPEDIDQAELSDCYLFVALGALAHVSPEMIKNSIVEDADNPGSYTVSLFRDSNGNLVTQHISAAELHEDLSNGGYFSWDHQIALWPIIAETAYAKLKGNGNITNGDNAIGHGGTIEPALHSLTGRDTKSLCTSEDLHSFLNHYNVDSTVVQKQELLNELQSAITANHPVAMGAFETNTAPYPRRIFESNGHVLMHQHAYMVLGVDGDKILLRNPQGHNDQFNANATILVNVDDLLNNSTEFVIGQ